MNEGGGEGRKEGRKEGGREGGLTLRVVSRRGLVTSGPLAREWMRMSILPKSFSTSLAT